MHKLRLTLCNLIMFLMTSSWVFGYTSPARSWISMSYNHPQHRNQGSIDLAVNTMEGIKSTPPASTKKPGISKYSSNRRKLLRLEPIRTQRAWLYSAVLPGLGQAYNNKYWKIYVFYGGFTLVSCLGIYHHHEYQVSRRELIDRPQSTSLYNYVQSNKRERNLYIAIAALWYILNILDAYVEGSLKTFDVSDNLEVIIQPTNTSGTHLGSAIGVGVSLKLKP